MVTLLTTLIGSVAFAIFAPILGCLLAGIDRKLTAKMQGRVGPPLLQPYYDVRKLLEKEDASVNGSEAVYIVCALIATIIAGGIFFSGGNFLLAVFIITLAALFFILAAYSTRSPYAEIGANREIVQVMAYEPMVLFVAIGLFLVTETFDVRGIFFIELPMALPALGLLIGLLYVLTIKLRKSPFDLSYSHHAHQELVKGITTEMSGKTLAQVEVMHWCETVFFLGWVAMFFVTSDWISIPIALAIAFVIFLFEIWIDNNFARVKWQLMVKSAWIVALVAGTINMVVLALL